VATDALLAQCGVIRVDTVEELFDMAMAFGTLPVPAGNRVAIVTNAGGPGIIIADACEGRGLEVVPLSEETQASLREVLAAEASVRNPVDMIASATPESYRLVLDRVLRDENVDAAIAAFVPPLGVRQEDVAQAIVKAKRGHEKPVLAVLMGREGLPAGRAQLQEAGSRATSSPSRRRRRWRPCTGTGSGWSGRRARSGSSTWTGTRCAVIGGRAGGGAGAPGGPGGAGGVPGVRHPGAGVPGGADGGRGGGRGEELGLPVVLKVESPDMVHKTDVGGVVLDLGTAEKVREEFEAMMARVRAAAGGPAGRGAGPAVRRGGRETIIGGTTDPTFGPLLMFGLGGIYVEALQDVVVPGPPADGRGRREMVRSIRGYKVLEGFRGEPPADQATLIEMIQRVSQLMGENPEIEELDINPFLVRSRAAWRWTRGSASATAGPEAGGRVAGFPGSGGGDRRAWGRGGSMAGPVGG
jgi:acetate---CoA ligase (ADP-forming)